MGEMRSNTPPVGGLSAGAPRNVCCCVASPRDFGGSNMRAILAAVVLLTLPSAEWDLLGSRRVSFTLDHDAILVGARDGWYTAIKIEVAGGTLEMYDVRLTFGNGDTWSPNTRVQFQEGSWSRTIDL